MCAKWPSNNPEEDAFHVRSTYARLDRIGVPGDGYEEGVERTRERAVLNHRMSVARFPPGMHRGESGEVEGLDPKESALRETLDRWVPSPPQSLDSHD